MRIHYTSEFCSEHLNIRNYSVANNYFNVLSQYPEIVSNLNTVQIPYEKGGGIGIEFTVNLDHYDGPLDISSNAKTFKTDFQIQIFKHLTRF